MCFESDLYQSLAHSQLQMVRDYCADAAAVLQRTHIYGSKAMFNATFTVHLYRGLLELMNEIPRQFDYYSYIHDFPLIRNHVDLAINCLLEDWLSRQIASPENTQNMAMHSGETISSFALEPVTESL